MLILNLGIILLGLAGSLAALGGDAWKNGDKPALKRVTGRGWIAILCLSAAFLLGGARELAHHRSSLKNAAAKATLQEKIALQQEQIARQLTKIGDLENLVEASAEKLPPRTERTAKEHLLVSIENAFKLAAELPRETDEAFISLRGQSSVRIPSLHNEQMLLYQGDQIHVVLMLFHARPTSELTSLRLKAGDREYPLHDGTGGAFFKKTLVIAGDSSSPMAASLLNPRRLKGVDIRLTVEAAPASRGPKEFRRLILSSSFRELAQKTYKTTTASILNMRASPGTDARVLSRLARGSLVRVIQSQGVWTEVSLPEGQQGWIATDYLGEIAEAEESPPAD